MNNADLGKTIANVRKHRDIKLVTPERKKKLFGVRTNLSYHKVFHWKLISNRNKKTQILMNKSVYSELLILELSKTLMYEFWYDYVKNVG